MKGEDERKNPYSGGELFPLVLAEGKLRPYSVAKSRHGAQEGESFK
jgi:hypothetical protein